MESGVVRGGLTSGWNIPAAKNDLRKREILRLHLINRVRDGADPGAVTPELAANERVHSA